MNPPYRSLHVALLFSGFFAALPAACRGRHRKGENGLEQEGVVELIVGVGQIARVPPELVLEGQAGERVVGIGQFPRHLVGGFFLSYNFV